METIYIMKKSTAFIFIVIAGFFLTAIIIGTAGYRTYITLHQISSVAKTIEASDPSVIRLKNIVNEIEGSGKIIMVFVALGIAVALFMTLLIIKYIIINNRYKEELIEAKENAEKLAHAKEEFISNMSHEIRTPMNVIMGFTDQLLKQGNNKQQNMFLLGIKRSTEHLLRLINDILDYSKIESGKLSIEAIGFMWKEVINDVYFILKDTASKNNIDFNYRIKGTLPDILIGDPVRLKQILLNLADNAIKFTKKGSVSIICEGENISNLYVDLKITVKDTGIGINKNKTQNIFEEFTQAETGTARKFGGSGLGLSICKKLVELQGGTIEVKSEEGKGSEFTFRIPYKVGTKKDVSIEEYAGLTDYSVLKGRKVLIVDDEELNRKLSKIILEENGLVADEAADGAQAIDLIKANEYDLVLMDIQMPGMSGLEATHILRKEKANLPVIALTANAKKEDEEIYIAAGMTDYLSKPFKEQELLSKILHVLNIPGKEKKAAFKIEKEEFHEEHQEEEQFFDLEELKKITHGDETFFRKIVELFIENTPVTIQKLKLASEQEKWDQVSMLAHKMRPSFAHMGIKGLAEILKTIEENAAGKKKLERLSALVNKVNNESEKIIHQLEQLIDYHPH